MSDSYVSDNDGAGWTVTTFPVVGTQDFSFIVYGDNRYAGENSSQTLYHERVMRGIDNDSPRLVLNVGDVVARSNNFIEWSGQHASSGDPQGEFFRIAGGTFELMQSTWFVPCKGNHETIGDYPELFGKVFENPYDGNGMGANTSEDYFAFDYGNARIISLNNNGNEALNEGDAQYNWLVSQLQAAEAAGKWIFVMVHQPPFIVDTYSSGKWGDGYMWRLQHHVVPLFEQYGVHMVFSGHHHVYVRWHNPLHYKGQSATPPVIEEVSQGVRYMVEGTATRDIVNVDNNSNGKSETYVYDDTGTLNDYYGHGKVKLYDLSNTAAGEDVNHDALPMYTIVSVSGNTCTVTTKGMYNAGWGSDNGNTVGTVYDTDTFTRGAVAPVADFSGSPTSGPAPLTVSFTDLSTNSPTSWEWDFGDTGGSSAQNPSHDHTSAGDYTVSLTATNVGGSDTETKTDYISVTSGPAAPR